MEDNVFLGAIACQTTVDMSVVTSASPYGSGVAPLTTAQIASLTCQGSSGPYNFNVTNGKSKTSLVVDGDITWKGRSLDNFLESIESRLAILQPNPEKLEKFEALKKAYEHYKLLETLINDEE
jgi:hypothetical protein